VNEERLVFDRIADDYDRVRPRYPPAIIDAACSKAELRAGSRIVEVGCGTGKLTEALVARRLQVEAIDPGPELVQLARRRVRDSTVRFHIGRFEDVRLPEGVFEAVFSATAFHWVDPKVGWAKVARLLRPQGVLALFGYVGGWGLSLTRIASGLELDEDVVRAWREVFPEEASWRSRDPKTVWHGAEERLGNVSELWAWLVSHDIARPEAAELFTDVEYASVRIEREETTEESLAVLRTTAAYLSLRADRREFLETRLKAILDDAGGVYRSTAFATVVSARAAT
jgi:SAM-dependent methyltransferase